MSEDLENFDDLFEELEFEFQDTDLSKEELELIDKTKTKTPETDDSLKVDVPESEEDFLAKFGTPDEEEDEEEDDDEIKKPKAKEEDEEEEDEDDSKEGSSEYFKAVGEGLFKLGKFGEIPKDFKWTQESFLEKFEELAESNAETRIHEMLTDGWGDEGIRMFNDIFIKKVPVREYLGAYAEIENYSELDLDKSSNQKLIVKTYLESMGVDEDEIYEQIELLEEKDKLSERAEKYRDKLVEDRAARMEDISRKRSVALDAKKKADRDRYLALSQTVTEALKKREINGIPLSTADDRELLRYVTAPAYKLQSGQEITELDKKLLELRQDPVKWVALGKLLKEDLNVTPIKKKGGDESSSEIFDFMKSKKAPKKSAVEDQLDLIFKRSRK